MNNRIVYVSINNPGTEQFFGLGRGSSPRSFDYPCNIHVRNTFIYVLDRSNSRIQKYSVDGFVPVTMLITDKAINSFNMFIDENEIVYLSVYYQNTIFRFMPNSSIPLVTAGNGIAGSASKQLNKPNGIYVDDTKAIYIADTSNHRIQKWMFNATFGTTVAGITADSGSSLTKLSYPESVVVDMNDYMYIVDRGNNRIVRWAPNANSGVCIAACTGIVGTRADQFYFPIAVAFDNQGSLYVSDDGNNRVQRFQILNSDNNFLINRLIEYNCRLF